MKNNKLAGKLILSIFCSFLIVAVITGGIFFVLFRKHTMEVNQQQLKNYTNSLAQSLTDYNTKNKIELKNKNGTNGYGAYLKLIKEVSEADIWIVDRNLNICNFGKENLENHIDDEIKETKNLPSDASKVVEKVFETKEIFFDDCSSLFSDMTVSVGAPIIDSNGEIYAVALLNSPVEVNNAAISGGVTIFIISSIIALVAGLIIIIIVSVFFTKPVSKMKETAVSMALGNYDVKCNIKQNDEIGELANILDELSRRLKEAELESEKLEKMRRDFVSNISHELRTPVTVIRGSLEALCDKIIDTPEKQEEYHFHMLSEVKFLERLVGDLLDLSRLQNADFNIEMYELNLCDVINDVVRSAKRISDNKKIEIKLEMDKNVFIMDGDYGRLRQMFMVIFDNAVKFSPENSTVSVILSEKKLIIKDEGCGIAQEELPYIFDRFHKSRDESNKSGTGLGLAIAQQIAQRHNIKLYAVNNQNGGTSFIFELS